jgi:4-hydroxythreonine-4-phosphate dehydrogenase
MSGKVTAPLILTPGEPGGVGAEITIKAWQILRSAGTAHFAVLADQEYLKSVAVQAALACDFASIDKLDAASSIFTNKLPVLHRPLLAKPLLGTFSSETATWVTGCIAEAVELCLSGTAAGMVTNPIQKEALYAAGFKHQGQTDFLATLCHQRGLAAQEVMMLVGGGLRAVPVTVHIALKDVATQLTQRAIETQCEVLHHALKTHFAIPQPRIAVTGLNPHAGENGSMGHEEINVIRPAIASLQNKGIKAFGPLPADTAFFPQARAGYDAIVCMYHDQALIPVKTLDFHGGVNVTLGLPFIRTSPDHGTALDLAGTGKAQAESLVAAITLAWQMASA